MWVFSYKVNSEGVVTRCRSRIVVRGDLQDEQTIQSTYAATLGAKSFRTAMAIAARFDLEIQQYDVVNAFVNAKREESSEPVFCSLPEGFRLPGKCVKINRALYGMRDSPSLWYNDFAATLKRCQLVPCMEEPCIFMTKNRSLYVLFFVDDVLLLHRKADQSTADKFIITLRQSYELRNMGTGDWFLGIRIVRNRSKKTIALVHDTYIEKIAKKFNQDSWKTPATPLPLEELTPNNGRASKAEVKSFQEKIGSILYCAVMIRADVAFACSRLSQFLTNPSNQHHDAADRVIRYLYGTRFLAIVYGTSEEIQELVIATDASFADDEETRQSSHGYTISLFGGLVAWRAARQDTVTTSTTEAELLGVAFVAKEVMAFRRFLSELQLSLAKPWTIWCDNQQTIRLIIGSNERINTRLRHVDVHNMWLRQEHQKGSFEVSYLPTSDMPADGLTKNLPRYKFEHFRALLNLQNLQAELTHRNKLC